MIGHRVRIHISEADRYGGRYVDVTGTLHKLDEAGAYIYREHSLLEGQGTVFIPMHRIHEIIDLGRAP